jgi:hypothetical protein
LFICYTKGSPDEKLQSFVSTRNLFFLFFLAYTFVCLSQKSNSLEMDSPAAAARTPAAGDAAASHVIAP